MWGGAFSDLAKKAHELQEQAQEQASHIAAPSFFNLDAMQPDGQEGEKGDKEMFITPQPSDHGSKRSIPQQSNVKENDDDLEDFISNKDPFAAFESLPTRTIAKKQTESINMTPSPTVMLPKQHFTSTTAATSISPKAKPPTTDSGEEGGGWDSFFNLDTMQEEDGGVKKESIQTSTPSRNPPLSKAVDKSPTATTKIPKAKPPSTDSGEQEGGWDSFFNLDAMQEEGVKKESMQTTTPPPPRNPAPSKPVDKSPIATTKIPKAEPPASSKIADSVENGSGWDDEDGLLDIAESNSGEDTHVQKETDSALDLIANEGNSSEMNTKGKPQVVEADVVDPNEAVPDEQNAEDIPSQHQTLNKDDSIQEPHALMKNESVKDLTANAVEETKTPVPLVDNASEPSPLLLPVEEATETVHHDTGAVVEVDEKDSVPNDDAVDSGEKGSVADGADAMNGDVNANLTSDSHVSESHDRSENETNVNQEVHTEIELFVEETTSPEVSSESNEQIANPSNQDADQLEIGSPESEPVDAGNLNAVPEYEDTVDETCASDEEVEHEVEQLVGEHDGSSDNATDDSPGEVDASEPKVHAKGMESGNASIMEEAMPEVSGSSVNAEDVTDEANEASFVNETAADPSGASKTTEQPQVLSQEYEQHVQQLQNAHNNEIIKLKKEYEKQMKEALDSFNHDKCESERQEMEQRFLNQFRGKEEQVQELMRENEGRKLRIDALKREVEGTQALLEQRDSTMGSVSASHNKNVELLEQRIQELNNAKSLAKAETDRAKEELQAARTELGTSNEAYSSLKARVKVVATELKERRIECRSLAGSVTELKQSNEALETQVANLQSQLSDRDTSQTEKDKDVLKLREQMESMELELHKTKSELKDRDSVGEKALSSYKKKAQNALAVANARAAAANQAKDEAELEATTARTMSEEAIQRATVTENAGKEALAEAKEYVREMETEKETLETKLSEACESLETSRAELEHVQNTLDASNVAQDKLAEDMKLITHEREEERGRNRELQRQLAENQQNLELLYEEVETLREDLRQANAIVASSSNDNSEKESRQTVWTHPTRASDELPDRSDAEGTIAMLEGDLRDANRAIKELKDALKNAIAEQGSNGYGHGMEPSASMGHYNGNPRHGSAADNGGNDSTPLFYAMEKQAELSTARDEINRLANLLGDAESSKMEAFEAMDELRRRMEEAEARLHRQEKFEGASRPTTAATTTPSADDNANLEYLKNIMLSYLNAKSLAEKKALVPVIAAVLCLTPEEQATAVRNIEESGGIEGVGRSLFETLGGSLGR